MRKEVKYTFIHNGKKTVITRENVKEVINKALWEGGTIFRFTYEYDGIIRTYFSKKILRHREVLELEWAVTN